MNVLALPHALTGEDYVFWRWMYVTRTLLQCGTWSRALRNRSGGTILARSIDERFSSATRPNRRGLSFLKMNVRHSHTITKRDLKPSVKKTVRLTLSICNSQCAIRNYFLSVLLHPYYWFLYFSVIQWSCQIIIQLNNQSLAFAMNNAIISGYFYFVKILALFIIPL